MLAAVGQHAPLGEGEVALVDAAEPAEGCLVGESAFCGITRQVAVRPALPSGSPRSAILYESRVQRPIGCRHHSRADTSNHAYSGAAARAGRFWGPTWSARKPSAFQ